MNDYPNIVERVATRQEQKKIDNNDKKKNGNKNVEAGREHYPYDNGDIAGFEEMMEDSKNLSPRRTEQIPKDLPQDQECKVSRQYDPYEVIREYKRLMELDN